VCNRSTGGGNTAKEQGQWGVRLAAAGLWEKWPSCSTAAGITPGGFRMFITQNLIA